MGLSGLCGARISARQRLLEEDQALLLRAQRTLTKMMENTTLLGCDKQLHLATRNALRELLRKAEIHEGVK